MFQNESICIKTYMLPAGVSWKRKCDMLILVKTPHICKTFCRKQVLSVIYLAKWQRCIKQDQVFKRQVSSSQSDLNMVQAEKFTP